MSVGRGTEANELNATYTTRGKQRDCLSCNQGVPISIYPKPLSSYIIYCILYTRHHIHYTGRNK